MRMADQVFAELSQGRKQEAQALLSRGGIDDQDSVLCDLLTRILASPPSAGQPLTAPDELTGLPAVLTYGLQCRTALRRGLVTEMVDEAKGLLDHINGEPPWVSLWCASLLQAVFRFSGDREFLLQALRLGRSVADQLHEPFLALSARGVLASCHLVEGNMDATAEMARSAIGLAESLEWGGHPSLAMAHQFLGYALFEWNRLEEAKEELDRAWELSRPEDRGVRSGVARIQADLALALGDSVGSLAWQEELEGVVSEPMSLRNREWLSAVRAYHGDGAMPRLRALEGWVRSFDYHPDGLERREVLDLTARLHELEHLARLLELTAQWEPLGRVAACMEKASSPSRPWFMVRALSGRAVALHRTGKLDRALEAWGEAETEAERHGYVRAIGVGSSLRFQLLRQSAAAGSMYAVTVLESFGEKAEWSAVALTPRQKDVLRALIQGGSNEGIGGTLGISESTVRTHLRKIFQILGASTRTEAVTIAQRLGLV